MKVWVLCYEGRHGDTSVHASEQGALAKAARIMREQCDPRAPKSCGPEARIAKLIDKGKLREALHAWNDWRNEVIGSSDSGYLALEECEVAP